MFRVFLSFLLLFPIFHVVGITTEEDETENYSFCNPDLFEENKGQFSTPALFKAEVSPILHLFVEKNGFAYVFRNAEDVDNLYSHHDHPVENAKKNGIVNCYLLRTEFLNSNETVHLKGNNPSPGVHNYFIGNKPEKWTTGVKKYGGASIQNLYNGIDLNLYCNKGNLKYDYIIAPGANPSQIKVHYKGASNISLTRSGLFIKTPQGDLLERNPVAYQEINGKRVVVQCRYELNGTTLSYNFPEGYQKDHQLIIDPELIAATYSGSTADNWGVSATYDNEGNIYLGGTIGGVMGGGNGYPVKGAFQQNYGGMGNPGAGVKTQGDAVISKFNQDGTQLIYASYLGGSGIDRPQSMVVNENQELYIFGATSSQDFTMLPGQSFDETHNGGFDIYVVKISADGGAIIGSTYIGGAGDDGINENAGLNPEVIENLHYNYGDNARGEIQLGANGDVFIASSTSSTDFPANGAFTTNSGGQDACLMKLNPDLTALNWATYLGGANADVGFSMVLDKEDNVYLAGGTKSADYPTTTGVINEAFGGVTDGVVSKVSADGGTLLASTFVGTNAFDQVYFIQLDKYEELYVFGLTKGAYPVQAVGTGIYEDPGSSQFVHKMTNTLNQTHFSTVFGNGDQIPNISPTAFLVDTCEVLFFSGYGRDRGRHVDGGVTTGLPITNDAFKTTTDGSDFYFLILQRDAKDIFYGTFFGEDNTVDHVDGGTARFDKNGTVYQSVCACGGARGLPTLGGAAYPTKGTMGGGCNSYILKFYLDRALLSADAEIDADDGCAPLTVNFTNGSLGAVDYIWDFGDGTPRSTDFQPTHVFTDPGTYKVMLIAIDSSKCKIADTAYVDVLVDELKLEVTGGIICLGDSFQFVVDSDGDTFEWTPAQTLNNANIKDPLAKPTVTTTYTVKASNEFCSATKEVTVEVIPELIIEIDGDSICAGDTTQLFVKQQADTYTWTPAIGLSDAGIRDPKAFPTVTTTYTVNATLQGCQGSGEVTVVVVPQPVAEFVAVPWETTMDDPNFLFKDLSENGITGRWDFGDNLTEVYTPAIDIAHLYNIEGRDDFPITYNVKLYIENELGCPDSITHEVKITGDWSIYVPNVFSPNSDGINDMFLAYATGIEEFQMFVYNRWGEVVFKSDDLYKGWNGRVRNKEGGEMTKQDVYVWKIVVKNIFGKKHKYIGHVTLTK